jgi:hypothetical protein
VMRCRDQCVMDKRSFLRERVPILSLGSDDGCRFGFG